MTLGSHQRTVGKSQTHLTPKRFTDVLGPFDLDPCAAPAPRPWPTAKSMLSEQDGDGLKLEWRGSVWLNPPFDRRQVGAWIAKMAAHRDGIALVHARTETEWFRPLWEADLLLFLGQRVKFCGVDGIEAEANSGAPVVLAAWGWECTARLAKCGLPGAYVTEAEFRT